MSGWSTYTTPSGDSVHVTSFETNAGTPTHDVEIVRDGEVIEYLADLSVARLTVEIQRRGWRLK